MTVNTKYEKPIPLKTEDNRPYWDAADRHELEVQKCTDCQTYLHPPGPACSKCGSPSVEWVNLGSDIKATLYTYVNSYRPFMPGFQHELPTVIAQAALDDHPEVRIMCNLLDCKPEDVQIGMPVKMIWQDITEDRALPQWVPTD